MGNGALRLVATKNGYNMGESTVQVSTSLGVESEEVTAGVPLRVGLAVKIHAKMSGLAGKDRDELAQHLANMAHEFCPYSRATRGNIDVEVIGEPADVPKGH